MHSFAIGNSWWRHLDFQTSTWRNSTFLRHHLIPINSLFKLLNSVSIPYSFVFIAFCRNFVVYLFLCFLTFLVLFQVCEGIRLFFLLERIRLKVMDRKNVKSFCLVIFWLYSVYFREEIMIDLTISQVLLFRNFVIKVLFLHYFSSLLLDLIFRFALFLLWCHFLPGFGHGLNH